MSSFCSLQIGGKQSEVAEAGVTCSFRRSSTHANYSNRNLPEASYPLIMRTRLSPGTECGG